MKLRARIFAVVLVVALQFSGCSSRGGKTDQVTQDLLGLPKETLFEKGKAYVAAKKYEQARKYLNFVFETYPNDPLGQKSLLLVADSYFEHGRAGGYLEARYRYRDYLTRYPAAPDRDYALFRYALCFDREHSTPDRDPTNIREALKQYQQLLHDSAASPHAAEARVRIQELSDLLADHDFSVGYFYLRKGNPGAALARFVLCEDAYPQYGRRDRLFYYAGVALGRLGRADESERYFGKLETDFPSSAWSIRARKEGHRAVDKSVASQ